MRQIYSERATSFIFYKNAIEQKLSIINIKNKKIFK